MRLRPFKRDFFQLRGSKEHPAPKSGQSQLWETSRKRSYRHWSATFFGLQRRKESRPRESGQRPVASARTAVKDQAASRRSARAALRVLDCVLAPALVLLWGAGAPLFLTSRAWMIAMQEENW